MRYTQLIVLPHLDHWLKFHQRAAQTQVDEFDNLDGNEIQPLLFGLVTDGDVDSVQSVLASSGGTNLGPEILTAARTIAVQQGSLPMVQILTPKHEQHIPANLVVAAVEGGDADVVKWALSKTNPEDSAKFVKVMLGTSSDQIYSLWEAYLDAIPYYTNIVDSYTSRGVEKVLRPDVLQDVLLKQPVFREVGDDPVKEARLKHTWKVVQLRGYTMNRAIVEIAKSSCSITLTKALIELGARLHDGFNEYDTTGIRALRWATKKMSKEAALFMQFLLSQGVWPAKPPGPEYNFDVSKFENARGAKQISKWLGVTWDELVKSNQEHSKQRHEMQLREWDGRTTHTKFQ